MNYQPPTPEDVRKLRTKHKLTQVALADHACVTERSVQMWEAPTGTLSHRYPSEPVWTLVLHKLGEKNIARVRRRK
jgi:predicted transcriptional regulator